MSRGTWLAMLAAWTAVGFHCGECRADFESDLLAKFKNQNTPPAKAPSDSSSAKQAATGPLQVTAVAGANGNGKPAVLVVTNAGTARVPDGGVRVLSSFSTFSAARNEAGVPILGGVPYLGRGFRNVGYGQFAGRIQTSVSVRIVSLAEEDARLLGQK